MIDIENIINFLFELEFKKLPKNAVRNIRKLHLIKIGFLNGLIEEISFRNILEGIAMGLYKRFFSYNTETKAFKCINLE